MVRPEGLGEKMKYMNDSAMSSVGLVPGALQGIDVEEFLAGAAAMDVLTRHTDMKQNPAALMALAIPASVFFMYQARRDGRGAPDATTVDHDGKRTS